MVVNLGEAQIFEWQMAEACNGVIGGKLALAYLFKKIPDGFGVQSGFLFPCLQHEIQIITRYEDWVLDPSPLLWCACVWV